MTLEETVKAMAILRLNYPNFCKDDSQAPALSKLWHEVFGGYAANEVTRAIMGHIKESQYAPTVADIAKRLPERDGVLGEREREIMRRYWQQNRLAQKERKALA